MKNFHKTIALCTLAAMLSGGLVFAEEHHNDKRAEEQHDKRHDNHAYVKHKEWRKGYHMRHEDWARAEKVDYRVYHLQRPPAGYEWRLVDGSYVLAAVATGVIASIVIASTIH